VECPCWYRAEEILPLLASRPPQEPWSPQVLLERLLVLGMSLNEETKQFVAERPLVAKLRMQPLAVKLRMHSLPQFLPVRGEETKPPVAKRPLELRLHCRSCLQGKELILLMLEQQLLDSPLERRL